MEQEAAYTKWQAEQTEGYYSIKYGIDFASETTI
jgi:hypothetical protein